MDTQAWGSDEVGGTELGLIHLWSGIEPRMRMSRELLARTTGSHHLMFGQPESGPREQWGKEHSRKQQAGS